MFSAIVSVILAAFLGALGWIFVRAENLATRVTVLESQHNPLLDYIKTRFDAVENRLDRIEHKQDTKE